jgi:hypothetical protein
LKRLNSFVASQPNGANPAAAIAVGGNAACTDATATAPAPIDAAPGTRIFSNSDAEHAFLISSMRLPRRSSADSLNSMLKLAWSRGF